MAAAKAELCFFINGKKVVDGSVEPQMTLLEYLRIKRGLTGTKLGCGEGGCGACTVMVSSFDPATKKVQHRSVNACLAPVCSVDGQHVITIEGIGSVKKGLHPAQEKIASFHGSQCGFCTPGIVMALYTHLRKNPSPTVHSLEEAFDGNLCRCTGYRPILDAAKTFATDVKAKSDSEDESKEKKQSEEPAGVSFWEKGPLSGFEGSEITSDTMSKVTCARAKLLKEKKVPEIAFPKELEGYKPSSLHIKGKKAEWYRPVTLTSLCEIKRKNPKAKLVVGNTEVGIEARFKFCDYPVLVSPTAVPELNAIKMSEDAVEMGAAASLTSIREFLTEVVNGGKVSAKATRPLVAMLDQLRWFSSTQIRNVGCLGGNLVTASPISDLCPVFLAMDATLTFASFDENKKAVSYRKLPTSKFFLDYRKVNILPGEVLVNVTVPLTRPLDFVKAYKQARRREDDIAIVTSCLRVKLSASAEAVTAEEAKAKEEQTKFDPSSAQKSAGYIVTDALLGFGGVWKTPTRAKRTEDFLKGKIWNKETLAQAAEMLGKDFPLDSKTPGGMPEYRKTLCASFLFKFFVDVSNSLGLDEAWIRKNISAISSFHRPPSKGSQSFQVNPSQRQAIGKPISHRSAKIQVSGEAEYVDDLAPKHKMLYAALVTSTVPHADIVSVDPKGALDMKGVEGYFGADDIKGVNEVGHWGDEELFASKSVHCVGQPIGVVVASTHRGAVEAARKVKIEYKRKPAVLSIDDAIKAKAWLGEQEGYLLTRGDIKTGEKAAEHVVEGVMNVGGQEHFYLETQGSEAIPGENGEMTIIASTQNPNTTIECVAHNLHVPIHKVVCKVKRMGGGFGGKETRSVNYSAAAAIAAAHLNRPVRIITDRNVDMQTSGQRHAFKGFYKVGFNSDGKLVFMDVKLYSNAGWCQDLSIPVMHRGLFHIDNVYWIPHVRAHGFVCKTNMPSHTAFRGFGGPQGLMVCEAAMDHVARHLGMPGHVLREMNLYKEGQKTHFGQVLSNCTVKRAWEECQKRSDFIAKREKAKKFNEENRWRKRGIALIPTKFGIAFTAKFMNQGGALVHIYTDGSVLVTHGGTEMGQGLHTKMIQVAAGALGVPVDMVYIAETATDKVPNTSPTAASMSSDINGMAVFRACEQITKRLKPLRKEMGKNVTWKELIHKAYFERINLSAQGFYKVPDVGYDFKTQSGPGFSYFSYGTACAEVEVDVLTGDHQILSVDIVMDVGNSLNPAIDIGQIEGAFTQGMGLFTIEELVWGDSDHSWLRPGTLFTSGPGAYKIPSFNDVPLEMNISLLKNAPNPKAIHSSKAIGEPPLFLAACVFYAIKEALGAAREEKGAFNLDAPATVERIRMASNDFLTKALGVKPNFRARGSW
eukprot:CAMPEP_0167740308 /NCGR_PEP_ID=MMETSP0110_2-20121227/202_1 /TAXON_ID=629695 /ORGANISM="Gymnochlora sp., Strain CCMP2014" /LENGTH=1376 /DNA_ID=CAMNT_0007624181 /DNA_START=571 /DNA_END=4701 /DNA_ORIENTATION=+